MRRPRRRVQLALAAVAVLLVAAPTGRAGGSEVPWAGGAAVQTPLERLAGRLASVVAGRPVQAECNSAGDWSRLGAAQGFDAESVWGFVVFDYDPAAGAYRAGGTVQLSEAACWYLDEYRQAPADEKGKRCRIATRVTFEVQTTRVKVRKRVKVNGRWLTRTVWVTRKTQVPIDAPRYGTCPDYLNRVFALQTLSHESQHLAGIRDEATAECDGMQRLAWFAEQFGATAAEAERMAGDYFRDFYEAIRPGTLYYEPSCPDPAAGG